jgi:hypothetical protein
MFRTSRVSDRDIRSADRSASLIEDLTDDCRLALSVYAFWPESNADYQDGDTGEKFSF